MEKLGQETIDAQMSEFVDWSLTGDSIQRTFGFEDFNAALSFVNRVAELAERGSAPP
jgi:pterin-4a-carbinolamine dehydratase